MIKISCKFDTPLSEEHILAGDPLRWAVGELELKSGLLTYQKWDLFTKLAQSIKLKEANSIQTTLAKFLDQLDYESDKRQKDDKVKSISETTRAFFANSLKSFKDTYGVIPENVAELIMATTEIEDVDKAYEQLYEYYNGIGETFPQKALFAQPQLQMMIMANYIARVATVESVLKLLEAIQQCNIEVKKKHLKSHTPKAKPERVSKDNLVHIFAKQMAAKRALEKSPS